VHYLIDGYNLLHHVGLLTGRVGPSGLEKARRALLEHLSGRFGEQAVNVTVVFDAQRAPPTAADTLQHQGIQVFFTRSEEADDLIEELIRRASAPKLLTVVSNDRRIREAARRRQCPVVECVEFWDTLGQRTKGRPDGPGAGEGKRDRVSRGEAQQWLEEFGDLDEDAGFKELFGPDFEEPAEGT
jgi:predicted RNA-binding protein with PIN domain